MNSDIEDLIYKQAGDIMATAVKEAVREVPLYQDPFSPVLTASPRLVTSEEQNHYIKEILDICCSDSRFSQKAYASISYVLNGGATLVPTVTSLVPSTVVLGSPSFDIHVMGTGFSPDSMIVFNGYDEVTTFVSSTELTTGVNMPLWQAPVVVPVKVRNVDGAQSTSLDFSFTEAVSPLVASASKEKVFNQSKK